MNCPKCGFQMIYFQSDITLTLEKATVTMQKCGQHFCFECEVSELDEESKERMIGILAKLYGREP